MTFNTVRQAVKAHGVTFTYRPSTGGYHVRRTGERQGLETRDFAAAAAEAQRLAGVVLESERNG